MRIVRNAISIAAMQASSLLMGLVLMPYITRLFGSATLGINSFGAAVAGYFGILGTLGLPLYGVREVARVRDNPHDLQQVASRGITYQLLFTGISTVLFALWVLLQTPSERPYLLLFCLLLMGTATDLVWLYGGLERFDRIAIRTVTMRALGTGLVLLVVRRADQFWLFIVIQQGAVLVSNVFYWLTLKRVGIRIALASIVETLRTMLRPASALFLPILMTTILISLDRVILGYLAPRSELAIYDYSARLARIGITLISVLGNVMFPRLTNLLGQGEQGEFNRMLGQQIRVGLLIGLFAAGGLFSIATPLCSILLGDTFAGADGILRIVSLPIFLSGMGLYFVGVTLKRENRVLKGLIISAVAIIIVDTLLIPKLGAKGAAIGYVVSELILQGYYLYMLRDTIRIREWLGYAVLLLLCTLVAVTGAHMVYTHNLGLLLVARGATFCLLLGIGAYVSSSSVRAMARTLLGIIQKRLHRNPMP